MTTATKFVSLRQAQAAVSTCKEVQADAQRCLQAQNPEELVPAILIRYRKLLLSLQEVLGWQYDDPTLETFRACHTPLNALQLTKMLHQILTTLGQADAPISASIQLIRQDAIQSIATSPAHAFIAKSREFNPISGYGLPRWITMQDNKPAFGVNVEQLLGKFDQLLSGLDLPPDWQDPTLRKRAEFDNPRAAWLLAETILDSLVTFVLRHCNDVLRPLVHRAASSTQIVRFSPASALVT